MRCYDLRPAVPRRFVFGLCVFVLALGGPAVAARAKGYAPPLGSLRLSFDPVNRVESRAVAVDTDFDLYLVADFDFADLGHPEWNATSGLSAFEFGMTLPPNVSIVRAEFFPAGATAPWVAQEDGVLCMVVSLNGDCWLAEDAPAVLVHFTARLLTEGRDIRLGIAPTTPSSFSLLTGGPGPTPGWLQCPQDSGELHPFAEYSGVTSLVLNPDPSETPSGPESWGVLKARYGG